MSIILSNCTQICHAQTNHSTAKMLYTFPKQNRFITKKTIKCDKFYEIKNTLSKRTTSFGYGYKSDFTKDAPISPPPNTYDLNKRSLSAQKKGIAFGQSRSRMVMTGPLVATITNKNPGPGNYQIPPTRTKISISLAARIENPNHEQLKVPGPGQYNPPNSLTKDGNYFLAKFKNSGAGNFGKKAGRCSSALNKIPGPGTYDTMTNQDLSPQGRYCLSKTANCKSRAFAKSNRGNIYNDNKTPGPGSYLLPSEFGYYGCKTSDNKENEN